MGLLLCLRTSGNLKTSFTCLKSSDSVTNDLVITKISLLGRMGGSERLLAGLCSTTLQHATCVKSAAAIHSRTSTNPQLLVSQGDRLLVFGWTNGESSLIQSVALYQGIEHIVPLQHPATKQELLFLVCEDDTVCAVRWVDGNFQRVDDKPLSLFLEVYHNSGQLRRPERVTVSQTFQADGTTSILALALYETVVHLAVVKGEPDGTVRFDLQPLGVDLRATPGRGEVHQSKNAYNLLHILERC